MSFFGSVFSLPNSISASTVPPIHNHNHNHSYNYHNYHNCAHCHNCNSYRFLNPLKFMFSSNRNRAPRPRRSPTPNNGTAPGRLNTTSQPPSRSPSPSAGGNGGGAKPLYLCAPFADAALVKGNFKTIVMLPKYADIMEWVAVNIFDFYTNLNEFYGVIAEHCTQHSCPQMSGGPTLNYVWTHQGGKQAMLPAPTYIDYVMTSIQNLIDDENTFPTKSNQSFHPSFPATVRTVYRQLLRVFAHMYHAHYPQILHLRSEPHFNSLFAHFLAFGREYELLEVRDIRGEPGSAVGVGLLWERWKEKGILEG